MSDFIVWDLETTGFVAPESKILEIGCLIFRGKECEQKHWVLDNKCEIPEKITEITGITKEIIDAEGREPAECLREFLPLFKNCSKNVTHNGMKFDIPFLVDYAAHVLKFTPEQKMATTNLIRSTAFDTAVQFKGKKLEMTQEPRESYAQYADRVMSMRVQGLKFNLGLCCDEFGIDRTGIVQHRALADVFLTSELYSKLVGKNEVKRHVTVPEAETPPSNYFAKEDAEAVKELENFINENNV